jgi:hypothetical protein
MSDPRNDSELVEQRLRALRAALLRWVLLCGGCMLAGTASVWIAITFVIDWWLHVPLAIRLIHLAVLLGMLIVLGRRWIWQPLRRLPNRSGLALLYERAYPQLQQVLVSAVELSPESASGRERSLRESILHSAAERARTIAPAGVLETRGPWQRTGLGALASSRPSRSTHVACWAPTRPGRARRRSLSRSSTRKAVWSS